MRRLAVTTKVATRFAAPIIPVDAYQSAATAKNKYICEYQFSKRASSETRVTEDPEEEANEGLLLQPPQAGIF